MASPLLRVRLSKCLCFLFGNGVKSESCTRAVRDSLPLWGLFVCCFLVLVLVFRGSSAPEMPFNIMNSKLRILSLS